MSMLECELALYKGIYPYFTPATRRLAYTYDAGRRVVALDQMMLSAVCRRITGFDKLDPNVDTYDGYHWFAVAEFVRDGHRIAVAFPWCMDEEEKDGVACDRSPAVYAHPRVIVLPLLDLLLEEIRSRLAARTDELAV